MCQVIQVYHFPFFIPFMFCGAAIPRVAGAPMSLPIKLLGMSSFISEWANLSSVQSPIFRITAEDQTVRFLITSSSVCMTASQVELLLLGLMPLLHSGCFSILFRNVLLFGFLFQIIHLWPVFEYVPCTVQEQRSTSSRSAVSSAVCSTLQTNTSPHIGPPVPRDSPV